MKRWQVSVLAGTAGLLLLSASAFAQPVGFGSISTTSAGGSGGPSSGAWGAGSPGGSGVGATVYAPGITDSALGAPVGGRGGGYPDGQGGGGSGVGGSGFGGKK